MQLVHLTGRNDFGRIRVVSAGLTGCCALVSLVMAVDRHRAADSERADRQAETARIINEVNLRLGLRQSHHVELVQRDWSRGGRIDLPVDGKLQTLDLRPTTVLGPAYELVVYGASGEPVTMNSSPATTIRGTVAGIAGAEFAGAAGRAGLEGLLLMPDGRRIWIEPVDFDVPGRRTGDHVVYQDEDRTAQAATCGAVTPLAQDVNAVAAAGAVAANDDFNDLPNDLRYAELAIDTDVEYFTALGSAANVEAEVTKLINIVNLQYEREVRISHTIVRIIVRMQQPDPYTTSDLSSLLDQFRNHWFASQSSVQRDVAHFFTGRVLSGGFAGVAYITGICSDTEGYSLVSHPACSSLACKTDLSAHELGHNWGAGHCSCAGWTMNTVVGGANQFHPTFTIPQIVNYRNTLTCLEIGDDLEALSVSATSATMAEANSLALTAMAEFRLHADLDVSTDVTWWVDPPALGEIDDQGVFTAAEVDGSAGGMIFAEYTFDGVTEVDSMAISVVDANPPLTKDAATPDKNRWLSIRVPPDAGNVALAVKMLSLYEPDPPHMPNVFVPNHARFEGQVRWVGPLSMCRESSGTPPSFRCAFLQCEPHFASDWGTDGIHVTGGDVLPSSRYELRTVPSSCVGFESTCAFTSAPLLMETQRWGDIVPPFQTPGGAPGTASQPDVLDIGTMVNKLKELPTIGRPQAQISGNILNADTGISIIDVGETVDSLKGAAPIFLSPCDCPSFATCPLTDGCGRCAP